MAGDIFGYDPGHNKLQKIIGAACFGAAAAHLESAEWMAADDGASAGAIDVDVTGNNLSFGALDVGWTAREKSGGQRKFGAVRDLECFIKIARTDDAERCIRECVYRRSHRSPAQQ